MRIYGALWASLVILLSCLLHGSCFARARVYPPHIRSLSIRAGHGGFYHPDPAVDKPGADISSRVGSITPPPKEILGVPRVLAPYYAAFMLDAVAVGLALP